MADYWKMVGAILHGVDALRSTTTRGGKGAVAGPVVPYAALSQLDAHRRGRSAVTSPYLPQFPNEQNIDYDVRRQNAPLTNIYNDISSNLAAKPFSKTCELDEATPEDLKKLAMNIDGQGNNLHVFAAQVFKDGLDKGIDWILVDFDKVGRVVTLAEERAIGARPYWVHIAAERMLAVYSDFVNGQEVFVHARIYEADIQRDQYDEAAVERVRVLNREPIYGPSPDGEANGPVIGYGPATWELHELQTSVDPNAKEKQNWVMVDSGPITIGIIPLVPYRTGKRDGTSWRVIPPLKDIAFLQIEEFQQESNLKTIKELTAFPMLAGNGVQPPTNAEGQLTTVPVGPRAILFAPPQMEGRANGSWSFIEPGASSLTFLAADLQRIRDEMRDLGKQPLATANLTVVTTANISMRAHSVVQAWALGLKDALEQAWKMTCMWLNQPAVEPVVHVYTDFGVDLTAETELPVLLQAETQGVISKVTLQSELKRRGVLSDDFDPAEEEKLLAEQQKGLQPEVPIDPRTGLPLGGQKSNVLPIKPSATQATQPSQAERVLQDVLAGMKSGMAANG
jgi:hypothetical protein